MTEQEHPQPVATAGDWQLVPKTLTEDMAREINLTGTFAEKAMQARYEAMLAVAPKPPVSATTLEAENKRLREALFLVRSIIVDGAMTGFNPMDGDWAERLYASQSTTLAALKGDA